MPGAVGSYYEDAIDNLSSVGFFVCTRHKGKIPANVERLALCTSANIAIFKAPLLSLRSYRHRLSHQVAVPQPTQKPAHIITRLRRLLTILDDLIRAHRCSVFWGGGREVQEEG